MYIPINQEIKDMYFIIPVNFYDVKFNKVALFMNYIKLIIRKCCCKARILMIYDYKDGW